ncbi:hypothetical protein [Mucilaginibacter myungsuensis]|uniref:Uncharacterized protein n=1 Tax=Mucilaginibacter myungsuensis TaxID=649104 RepID=A0A929L310_9SPHI|nr:hypothetical protein [Mucilaginibacter myungsuensis]MBE9663150.1 hypothetical protein [Mucilaginibacter myungsuensis]MDN3598785.1 hypothetical protein [Mucilaginibacter myungsuensis]
MKNIPKDELSRSWFMVCNAMPPVGFFLYFKHRKQYPNKARRALTSAMIGVPMALVMSYIINTHILK